MNTSRCRRLLAAFVSFGSVASTSLAQTTPPTDPRITSWFVAPSGNYARLYESTAAKNAGTAVTTWSRNQGVQSTPSYAGVMQVSSSDTWVYPRPPECLIRPDPAGFSLISL